MIAQPCSKSFIRPLKPLSRTSLLHFLSRGGFPPTQDFLTFSLFKDPLPSQSSVLLICPGGRIGRRRRRDAFSRSHSQCDFLIFAPSCNNLLYSLPSLCRFLTLSLTDMNGLYKTSRCRSRTICAWHTYRATRDQRGGNYSPI